VAIGLAVVGIVIGAVKLSFHGPAKEKLRKGLGVALLVGGSFAAYSWKLAPATHIPWIYDEAAAFAKAKAEGKGVIVDFAASWCEPCTRLEVTFGDVDVHSAIVENFVPLKFDVSDDNDANEALKARFLAKNLPAVRFLDANGNHIGAINAEVDPAEALKQVNAAAAALRSTDRRATNP
jgi:thiol:disulfide interchange protein DsbD